MNRYWRYCWVALGLFAIALSGCDEDEDARKAKAHQCNVVAQSDGKLGIVCNNGHQVDVFYADSNTAKAACSVVEDEQLTSIVCADKTVFSGELGKKGAQGARGVDGKDGGHGLLRLEEEPPGEHCENGGVAVYSGIDLNGDGELSADEIQSITYVCNGENGQPGLPGESGAPGEKGPDAQQAVDGTAMLVRIVAEPAGSNCPHGGYAVQTGMDTNEDGVLSDNEITSTDYVCHGGSGGGESGSQTPDGADGAMALIRLDSEEPGHNCAHGGIAIASGLDHNSDGILADEEVTSTQYVCSGADGMPGDSGAQGAPGGDGVDGQKLLVRTDIEPAGSNCPAGGVVILMGFDQNNNGVLDDSEIEMTQTQYVCTVVGTTIVSSQPSSA